MTFPSHSEHTRVQTMLLLRWVLIIATSYLMLFSRPLRDIPPLVALFVSTYFASNVALASLLRRIRPRPLTHAAVVLFDALAICVGLLLADNVSSDFFLLYFLVLFLGALTQRLDVVVAAAVIAGVIHLVTLSRFVDATHLIEDGYIVRVPFLFVVAVFFAHMVQQESQGRERTRIEFLSTISHDLKNPLAVIQSIAELLLAGNAGRLTEDQAQMVRRIFVSARHVISLSHNLVNAAWIEAGQLTLLRTPVRLDSLMEETVSVVRAASELKGVKLESGSRPNLPTADLDAVQIERVMFNLLDNAVKYTPPGGTVSISIDATPGELFLTVTDNGPGISTDELPNLFERYRRPLRRGQREGSGLGLYITKAIVEAHGGTMAFATQPEGGTAFTVTLPVSGQTAARTRSISGMFGLLNWWPWPARSKTTAGSRAALQPGQAPAHSRH